nr:hypothetical protein [Angustibacter aerolatus]
MKSKVVPRLEAMYAERTAAIEGQIEQADKAQAEAQQALEQYRAQAAESREEASRIREEARAEGAQILAEPAGEGAVRLGAADRAGPHADRRRAPAGAGDAAGRGRHAGHPGSRRRSSASRSRTRRVSVAPSSGSSPRLEAGEVEVQRPAAAGSTAVGVGGDA